MRAARSFFRRWPFLTVGLFTFALFLVAEVLDERAQPLLPVLRVLIVPIWLMRTLEMFVGIGRWPGPLQFVIALPLLFLPYVAGDLLLGWGRRRWRRHSNGVA